MISFEKKVNDNKEKKEFLNIQCMDIVFILKYFSPEILKQYLENDLMKVFIKIDKQIINSTEEYEQFSLLGKSYQFDITNNSKFKEFVELLIKQNVLFDRKEYGLTIPYSEYEINSHRFIKYIIEQTKYYDYIGEMLESGLANDKKALRELNRIKMELQVMGYEYFGEVLKSGLANDKKALQELNRIKMELQVMAYEFKESGKKACLADNKPKIVLFFSDIMGTINYAKEEDYEALAQKLLLLKDKNGADEIIFSLITGDENRDYLLNYVNKIAPFLKQYGIGIGRQFMDGEYYNYNDKSFIEYFKNWKIDKIIDYANELKDGNDIVSIYYADDNPTYYDDRLQKALGDTYYCCLGIENDEALNKDNFTGSSEENIKGVLQAIDFHINPEKIKEIKTLKLTMKQANPQAGPYNNDDNA